MCGVEHSSLCPREQVAYARFGRHSNSTLSKEHIGSGMLDQNDPVPEYHGQDETEVCERVPFAAVRKKSNQ